MPELVSGDSQMDMLMSPCGVVLTSAAVMIIFSSIGANGQTITSIPLAVSINNFPTWQLESKHSSLPFDIPKCLFETSYQCHVHESGTGTTAFD